MCIINFTPFPNLSTEHLNLRQLTTDDENEFFILKSDERILKYLNYRAKTFDESRQFLHKLNVEIAQNECIVWGITLKGENKLIGTICFWNISIEQSKAEIGYELMSSYQGKGIMQEAIATVIKYGFENMKLKEIEALPNTNNSRSVNLLERNNFIKKSTFNENDYLDGKILDMAIYTLTNNNAEELTSHPKKLSD